MKTRLTDGTRRRRSRTRRSPHAAATRPRARRPRPTPITIGSAAFPENEIIAEIYAQALEAKDFKVEKKLNIGAREAYIPALKNGEIDLLPEYSGNLLLYLDKDATATAPDDVDAGAR